MTTDQPIVTKAPAMRRMTIWVVDTLFGSKLVRWFENPITQSLSPVSNKWLIDHVYNEGKEGFQL